MDSVMTRALAFVALTLLAVAALSPFTGADATGSRPAVSLYGK